MSHQSLFLLNWIIVIIGFIELDKYLRNDYLEVSINGGTPIAGWFIM